jgi:regulator of RNase E activity RraA
MYIVNDMPPQIEPDLVQKLAQVETATVGHFRHHGFMSSFLTPIIPGRRAAGTAVTVSTPGPDSTVLHHAMSLLRRGDFLIIDRCGDTTHACWGGVINQAARTIGLAGVVVDGPATDPSELREHGVLVWSRGVSPVTTKPVSLGGHVNVPVSCGNVAVLPGDAILADESGILVMRRDEVEEVVRLGLARQQREPEIVRRILAGEPVAQVSGASLRFDAARRDANKH